MNLTSETPNQSTQSRHRTAEDSLNAAVLALGHATPASQLWRMSIRGRYALCGICVLLSASVVFGVTEACIAQECNKKIFAVIILSTMATILSLMLFINGLLNISKFLAAEWIIGVLLLVLTISAAAIITASSRTFTSVPVEKTFSWGASVIAFLIVFVTVTAHGGLCESKFLPQVAQSVRAAQRSSQMTVSEAHYMEPVGVRPTQAETVIEPMKELPNS